jgi:hypothetical protein
MDNEYGGWCDDFQESRWEESMTQIDEGTGGMDMGGGGK